MVGSRRGRCVSSSLRLVTAYQQDGLSALADPTRRAIFEQLADHPQSVGELAAGLPVSRPAVSQHLKVLKGAGLAAASRAGNRRIYRLDPAGVAAMRDQLDQYWNRALSAYKAAVEEHEQEDE